MTRTTTCLLTLVCCAFLAGAVRAETAVPEAAEARALAAMTPKALLHSIEVLSSDDFEGRSVGTHGGEVTEDYLEAEFRRIGLAPGAGDGSYRQRVPLSGHLGDPVTTVHVGGKALPLKFREDIVDEVSISTTS